MRKRGHIYFDKSYKGMKWGKPCNHNCWRADITIHGVRYRKRSRDKSVCEEFIQNLINKFDLNKSQLCN